ncbi:MAG: hypothetical protein R3C44_15025 [Chloroflexota bacterium]
MKAASLVESMAAMTNQPQPANGHRPAQQSDVIALIVAGVGFDFLFEKQAWLLNGETVRQKLEENLILENGK